MSAPAPVVQHDRTGPSPDVVSLLVVDRAGVVSDDVWSMLAVRRDLRVVARLATADRLRSVVDRDRPDSVVVTWSGAVDDPEVVTTASGSACLVIVDDVDAITVAHALRAGARGVVSTSTCSSGELAVAARAVLVGGAHLSSDVAEALGTGFRDQRLRVATGDVDRLTRREREVMRLVADGRTNAQIADTLEVSRKTVKNHLTNVYTKLGVTRRAAAVATWQHATSSDS